MILPDEIRSLRDRALADLASAHDYYSDTEFAWSLVETLIAAGGRLTRTNQATGTVTSEAELVARSRGYVAGPLVEATFQQFLAIFENFFLDFLTLWLTAYPQSLGAKTVEFRAILDLPDKEAITRLVVRKELNEVLYERPSEWFAYLESRARLGCPTDEEIARIAEAKASRDVLAHNGGVVNRIYLGKAGGLARYGEGERIEVVEPYHRRTWELLGKVVAEVCDAAIAKVS